MTSYLEHITLFVKNYFHIGIAHGLIYLNILILIIGYQILHVLASFECFRILIEAESNESETPQLRQYFTFTHLPSMAAQRAYYAFNQICGFIV